MVEAVVALPVFVLLFVSVFYLRDLLTNKQDAEMQARTCAFLYSENGCKNVPAGCEGLVRPGMPKKDDPNGSLDASLQKALKGGAMSAMDSGDNEGVVYEMVATIVSPVIEQAFQKKLTASTQRKVPRPLVFGGESTDVNGSFGLACNIQPVEPGKIAKDSWFVFNKKEEEP